MRAYTGTRGCTDVLGGEEDSSDDDLMSRVAKKGTWRTRACRACVIYDNKYANERYAMHNRNATQ